MSNDRTIGFQTYSLYHFDIDAGLSERFKSRDVTLNQEGWHPAGRVFFVKNELKQELTKFSPISGQYAYRLFFADDKTWTPATNIDNTEQPEGTKPIVTVWDRGSGKCVKAVAAELVPDIGLCPIEKTYFDDGKANQHVGSPIEKLFTDQRTFDNALKQASIASGVSLQAKSEHTL